MAQNSLQNKAIFVSFCIEQYAKAKGMTPKDTATLFEQYGVLDHYSKFYDVLHTQGREWIVADIDEFIQRRKSQ